MATTRFLIQKRIFAGIAAVLVLTGLWYAFRPEKLFINTQVNEAAPETAQEAPTPIFTGRFAGEAHKTSGRATIYKQADGTRLLRLTDFFTSNGPQLHVLLVDGKDPNSGKDFSPSLIKTLDLGDLKGNQGDQSYKVPDKADLRTFNTVTIYCERFHANFGLATLQAF